MIQCQRGDTAAAIPVLERELTNAGIALPGRGPAQPVGIAAAGGLCAQRERHGHRVGLVGYRQQRGTLVGGQRTAGLDREVVVRDRLAYLGRLGVIFASRGSRAITWTISMSHFRSAS